MGGLRLKISSGAFSKFLSRLLSESKRELLLKCFPGNDFVDIFEKEVNMMALFDASATKIAATFYFPWARSLYSSILEYMRSIENLAK